MAEASTHAQAQRHAEAIKACLGVLHGAPDATVLATRCVAEWEQAERRRIMSHEDEKKSIMAQLMDVRDRCTELRHQRDAKETELQGERHRRQQAEEGAAVQRARAQEMRQEILQLKQQVQQLKTSEAAARRAAAASARPSAPSREEVVRRIAEFECEPLKHMDSTGQAGLALKKKILLKWHPDKQPCADFVGLATQVMQELQNRPEW